MAFNSLRVSRALPTPYGENRTVVSRSDRYGNQVVAQVSKPMNEEAGSGCYFVATNATPGTGVAGIAAADGLDNTEAYFYLRNTSESTGTNKYIYLDYVKLITTAAGTNGTNLIYASKIDTGSTRFSSGGSAVTPVNCNMDSDTTFEGTLRAGAVVLSAATGSVRLLSHGTLRSAITVVGDSYLFDFGGGARAGRAALQTSGTAIAHVVVPHCPVVLGPSDAWCFHLNAASQSAASSFEFEIGLYIR